MEEIRKVKIAKEIKTNFKILVLSLIVGLISYPILVFNDGGFKAWQLKRKLYSIILNTDVSDDIKNNYNKEIYYLGGENNTVVSEWSVTDSTYYNYDFDERRIKFQNDFNYSGYVYKYDWDPNFLKTFVVYCSNIYTLNKTIEKVFGVYNIMRSVYVFLIVLLSVIVFRYLYSFIKWVYKYSK